MKCYNCRADMEFTGLETHLRQQGKYKERVSTYCCRKCDTQTVITTTSGDKK